MTSFENERGPGYSPGTDEAEVAVHRTEPTIEAPIQDGAQELREEAAAARTDGAKSRADNLQAPGTSSEQAHQTKELDPDMGGEAPRSGG